MAQKVNHSAKGFYSAGPGSQVETRRRCANHFSSSSTEYSTSLAEGLQNGGPSPRARARARFFLDSPYSASTWGGRRNRGGSGAGEGVVMGRPSFSRTGEGSPDAYSDEAGQPVRWKAATLSERSDEQGSWLVDVAGLTAVCHVFSSPFLWGVDLVAAAVRSCGNPCG